MASLQGTKIKNTYPGLLKTDDNGVVGAAEKRVTDGQGNATNMTIGTGGASFDSGTVDFTGATVSGLPADVNTTYDLASAQNLTNVDVTLTGSDATVDTVTLAAGTNITLTDNGSNQITIDASGGAAGLESGTGTDSMQSAASLTTLAANASGACSIALGDGAVAVGQEDIVIGKGSATGLSNKGGTALGSGTCADDGAVALGRNSKATNIHSIAIAGQCNLFGGVGATASGIASISIGTGAVASAERAVTIGENSDSTGAGSTAVGQLSCAQSNGSVAIGKSAHGRGAQAIAIGESACAYDAYDISIGFNSDACGPATVAIGWGAQVGAGNFHAVSIGCGSNAGATYSYALGSQTSTTASGAYALGCAVTAAKANTVSVIELETQLAGGGIYLTTPDGLAQPKLTVNNSSELLIGGNPVGGGAAGLESGTGVDSMQSAASLTTTGANASTDCSIALGFNATTPGIRSVAIGRNALSGPAAVSIGPDSDAGDSAVAIGTGACAGSTLTAAAVAIGQSANTGNNNRAVALGSCTVVSAACGLAIGNETTASGANAIHIAGNASFSSFAASGNCSIAIGHAANTAGAESVSLGLLATAPQGCAVAVGKCARACGIFSVALGNTAFANNQAGNIAIGGGACASAVGAEGALAIGYSARSCAPRSIAFGYVATVCNAGSVDGISIGNDASVGASNGSTAVTCGVAVGFQARACANGSVALGSTVVASKVDTVTIKELETCVAGGGITMKSPNGTEYKLTVSDAGALVIT